LILRSDTMSVSDPAFKDAVTTALAPIKNDPRINSMTDPYNAPSPRVAQAFTSRDGHEALVSVELKSTGPQAWKDYDALRTQVKSDSLTITGTGFVPINKAFNTTLESDLQRAETVTLPVTLILLVVIFASVVAAGRAITFSGITVAVGLSAMLFFQGTFLASMGAAGAIVVGIAVLYGLTFLPALLSIIGPSVNRWRLPAIFRGAPAGQGFWHGLA